MRCRQCCTYFGVVVVAVLCYTVLTAFEPSPPITAAELRATDPTANVIELVDGRVIEYFVFGGSRAAAASGGTSGQVLVALHGAQTTGKLFQMLDAWGVQNGVTIVAPTLPGFGFTSNMPGVPSYRLEDWVTETTTHVLNRVLPQYLARGRAFHVLGTSLGSIHAAALSSLYESVAGITNRVGNIELYVGFAPAETGVHDPLSGSVLEMFGTLRRSAPTLKRVIEKLLILPALRNLLPTDSDVVRSVSRQWEGAAGCVDLIYQSWNFSWRQLVVVTRSPSGTGQERKVVVVSGSDDTVSPSHNQKRLAQEIKGAELVTYTGTHERSIQEPKLMIQHLSLILPLPTLATLPTQPTPK